MEDFRVYTFNRDGTRKGFWERLKITMSSPVGVVISVIFAIILLGWLNYITYEPPRRYCGKVTEKMISKPVYDNYRAELVQPIPYIVFFSDSLHKYIGVRVSIDTYERTRVGDNACFMLDRRQTP